MSLSESHSINMSVLCLKKIGAFDQNGHTLQNWENPPNSVCAQHAGQKRCRFNGKAKVLFIASADLLYGTLPLQENCVN